jgi:putative hydrolase
VTDNIFDRLAELLQSAGPVNWRLGRQIAESVAGAAEPVDPWVAEEYEELGRTAVMLLERSGAADPGPIGPLTIIDARGWAADNVEGYAWLAEPLAEKVGGAPGLTGGLGMEAILGQLGPALVGLQVGSLAGTMARTLLGSFDAVLPPLGVGPQVVVANVEALASAEGLDPRQARLWAVLREISHQAVLEGPWLAGHLEALAAEYVGGLEMRPDQLQDRLKGLEDPGELERLLSEPGGLSGLAGGPELEGVRDHLTAALAVIDGFGRTAVRTAAGTLLPDLAEIEASTARRRLEEPPERVIEQMLGLEVDPELAAAAAGFIDEITNRWGTDAVGRMWESPEGLPTVAEIHDPVGWAARVLLDDDLSS